MDTGNFKNGIAASIENGDRLLEDAKSMLEWERFPTAYALAVLAQEGRIGVASYILTIGNSLG